jgi:YD repeat-containing protein
MEIKSLVSTLAEQNLSESEKLALIGQLETSIQEKKIEQSSVNQAAKMVATRFKDLEKLVKNSIVEMEQIAKIPGPQGPEGKQGKDGKSIVGPQGRDGKDGKDGVDGQTGSNGVSVVDAYFAADNSLVLVLSNGEEIDAGAPYGLGQGAGGNINVLTQTGETAESLATKYVAIAFETVSKNLRSADGVINFTGDLLTSIVYADGITKTLNYDGSGLLTSVVLSGSTPVDIALTKTFTWDASDLPTAFTYS